MQSPEAARLNELRMGTAGVATADLERLLRVVPLSVLPSDYGDYYRDHRDALKLLEVAWRAGDLREYFYLHHERWWLHALKAVGYEIFWSEPCESPAEVPEQDAALYDDLLADTRYAERGDVNAARALLSNWLDDIEWEERLEFFNVHRSNLYMTAQEAAEWAALPEKLVLYIGWQRNDPSEYAQIWTLDYNLAQEDADRRRDGDVFMTVVPKEKVKGYINRHGRQEVILAWDDVNYGDLEPYQGPVFKSKPLES